ncbi:60s ribosomal protein l13a-4 [Quercus suber]|uniref:60s ribosomal protein l13a-4 n=1 Tax=Quercus suber TaxID=58331 RepID=A0AAW0LZM9_QUESU
MVSSSGICAKRVVEDARHHMLGRLSSIIAKELLNGQKVELERKRKERAQVAYERKKQLTKLRVKAEKTAEEKLGPQLEVIAPIKY